MTLEKIALYSLINNYLSFLTKEGQDILKDYNVTNASQLETFILSGNKDFNRSEFTYIIKRAKATIDKIEKEILYNRTYNIDYEDPLAKEKLTLTDQTTPARVLMVTNPVGTSNLPVELAKINISLTKYLLQSYDIDGNNALVSAVYGLGVRKTLWNLIEALKFYNSYLLKIYALNPNYEGNLFFKDKDEKLELVKAKLNLILDMLDDHQSFIWGPSDYVIDIVRREAKRKYHSWQYRHFINYISDYTTLEELQDDTTLSLALRRFKKN